MNEKLIEIGEFIHKSLLNGSSKTNPAFDEAMLLFVCNSLTVLKEHEAVVRCKDCINCVKEPNGELYCDILAVGYEPLGSKKVRPDWFCADGERKEGR